MFTLLPSPELASELRWPANPNQDSSTTFFCVGRFENTNCHTNSEWCCQAGWTAHTKIPEKHSAAKWQLNGSKALATCICLCSVFVPFKVWENQTASFFQQLYTFINVFFFTGSTFNFYQYKNQKWSQILHTGFLTCHTMSREVSFTNNMLQVSSKSPPPPPYFCQKSPLIKHSKGSCETIGIQKIQMICLVCELSLSRHLMNPLSYLPSWLSGFTLTAFLKKVKGKPIKREEGRWR